MRRYFSANSNHSSVHICLGPIFGLTPSWFVAREDSQWGCVYLHRYGVWLPTTVGKFATFTGRFPSVEVALLAVKQEYPQLTKLYRHATRLR